LRAVSAVTAARSRAARPRRLDAERRLALNEAWQALWASRALVWIAGLYAILKIGLLPGFVAPQLTAPYGGFANLLVGPGTRWDSEWYLSVAQHGYGAKARLAFFPLYPLAIKAVGFVVRSQIVAGILISLVALLVALYLLHRLTTLELGAGYARGAVLLMAFFPMALFFSAVYTESLLLALTIGAVYAARLERWALAGVLGAFASATRNTGVLIVIPLLLLYLYGPRAAGIATRAIGDSRRWRDRIAPRYAPRRDLLWLALVPLGLLAFLLYSDLAYGDFLRPLHATEIYWHRHFHFLRGIPRGATFVWHALRQIASGSDTPLYPVPVGELADPYRLAAVNLVDFGFLILVVGLTVGALRSLPFAYGAYCVAGITIATSAPQAYEPLASFSRYAAVLFPIYIWLSRWATDRRRLVLVVASLALGLGIFETQFATWRWVA
jgi:hypothetical protein